MQSGRVIRVVPSDMRRGHSQQPLPMVRCVDIANTRKIGVSGDVGNPNMTSVRAVACPVCSLTAIVPYEDTVLIFREYHQTARCYSARNSLCRCEQSRHGDVAILFGRCLRQRCAPTPHRTSAEIVPEPAVIASLQVLSVDL